MRIHSITVRNYRVHQDITVALDPSRTVVGGLNESGKSTLIEAAHRALFMRYKT
ncbi:AAA family ATPase, partial [Gemmatimonas sp.]|uniref:AAA family ATPase n=1 Tax=Gemmatimonas sp. TaxID=1962908 RepID=UPI003568A0FC